MFFLLRRPLRSLALISALVTAIACSDPEVTKRQHLERGDALAKQRKFQEAVLEYRNAIKADRRFGEARFGLAEAYLQTGNRNAGTEFLRAAELLPDRADVQAKAAYIMLVNGKFEEAQKYAQASLKADPKNADAQLTLANALAGLQDMDGAVKQLEEAMLLAPDDARPYIDLGKMTAQMGNLARAETAFKRATDIDPRSVPARLALGYFYWATRRFDEAHQTMQSAYEIDRENPLTNRILALFYIAQNRLPEAEAPLLRLANRKEPNATLALAELYARTQRVEQAKPLFEKLKAEKGTRTVGIARLATLAYAENKRVEAHAQVDEALKETPNNIDLLVLKTRWLGFENKLDEALSMAKRAVAASEKSAAAQYAIGQVYAARGELDEAITAYGAALAANPQLTQADLQLSALKIAQGKAAEALTHARAAEKTRPKDPEVRLAMARATLANRDIQGAVMQLKALQGDYPRNPNVHSLLGQALLARSDLVGAKREFDAALEVSPSHLDALSGRVIIDLREQRVAEGRARVERALARNPTDAKLLMLAGRFEATAKDAVRAERYMQKAIDLDPTNAGAYHLLANFYGQQKRLDEARKSYEEVVRRRPDNVGAHTMIGMILDSQNRHDESLKVYETIVAKFSKAPLAANNLAYLYAERNEKLDAALELAQTAKRLLPESPDVSDTLGWVYYKKGMAQQAIQPLEFSASKNPNNADYLFHLGMAYAKVGDTKKARSTLEQALKLKPDLAGASEARATLAALAG